MSDVLINPETAKKIVDWIESKPHYKIEKVFGITRAQAYEVWRMHTAQKQEGFIGFRPPLEAIESHLNIPDDARGIRIEVLCMSYKTSNVLTRSGIYTLGELDDFVRKNGQGWYEKLHNCGVVTYREIIASLNWYMDEYHRLKRLANASA